MYIRLNSLDFNIYVRMFILVEESLLFRSGLISLKLSESISIRKINPDLNNKDSSNKLNMNT